MKRPVLLLLYVSTLATAAQAQQLDKYADFYFYAAFNKQPEAIKAAIAADSAQTGFFLITNIQIDTLNKHELRTTAPAGETPGVATVNFNGTAVGVLAQSSPGQSTSAGFDLLQGAVAVKGDSFKVMALSRTALFRNTLLSGFDMMMGKDGPGKAQYVEEALDSATIYRSTASAKKRARIEVPAYISNAFTTVWPGNAERVYGKAVITTDAFYVQDENFTGKYLLKRYTIDVAYRSVVKKL